MNFVRLSTRLHTDIYEAYRYLSRADKIEKWLGMINPDVTGEPYQKVVWHLQETNVTLEFYLMKCAVKTEYCTEVNLLVRFTTSTQIHDSHREVDNHKYALILESLRKYINKDWVIQDKDLTAGVFRQSL